MPGSFSCFLLACRRSPACGLPSNTLRAKRGAYTAAISCGPSRSLQVPSPAPQSHDANVGAGTRPDHCRSKRGLHANSYCVHLYDGANFLTHREASRPRAFLSNSRRPPKYQQNLYISRVPRIAGHRISTPFFPHLSSFLLWSGAQKPEMHHFCCKCNTFAAPSAHVAAPPTERPSAIQ